MQNNICIHMDVLFFLYDIQRPDTEQFQHRQVHPNPGTAAPVFRCLKIDPTRGIP